MKHFGEGLDFTGFAAIKPLADLSEKAGSLKLGAGYGIGKYYISYNVYSFFLTYDYGKFHFRTEYANADGYNSAVLTKNKADGYYSAISFDLTPKISLSGRYDYFNSNKDINDSDIQEFTAGITYKAFKNMKLMLNYVRRNYSNKDDSNMILFATRFII